MLVTLYNPGQPPRALSPDGFSLPDAAGLARISDRVAEELGCTPSLVDVLDTGPGYVAYSIFDCEGGINTDAIQVLKAISKHGPAYGSTKEEDLLRGPILLIRNH